MKKIFVSIFMVLVLITVLLGRVIEVIAVEKPIYLIVSSEKSEEKVNEFAKAKPWFHFEVIFETRKEEEVFVLLRKFQPKFLLLVGDIPVPSILDGEQQSDFGYAYYKNKNLKKQDFFKFEPDVFVGRAKSMRELYQNLDLPDNAKVDLLSPIGAFPWRKDGYWGVGSDFSYPAEAIRKKFSKSFDFQFVSEKDGDMTSPFQSKNFRNFEKRKTLLTFAPSSMERNVKDGFIRSVWTDLNKDGFLTVDGVRQQIEVESSPYLMEPETGILVTNQVGASHSIPITISGCSEESKFYYYNADSKLESGFQNLIFFLILDSILSGKSVGESVFNVANQYDVVRIGQKYEWEIFTITYFTVFGDPSYSIKDRSIDLSLKRQIDIGDVKVVEVGNSLHFENGKILLLIPVVSFWPSYDVVFFGQTYFIVEENGSLIKHLVKYKILNLLIITPNDNSLGVLPWLLLGFVL